MKIQNTKDQSTQFLNVLVCGSPGSGKTTFIGSSQEPKTKSLVLSAESGLLSIKDKGVDFVTITKFEDLIKAYEYLAVKDHGYTTIGMDSLTEIQTICMDSILAENGREKPQISDWGTLNTRMVAMIRKFRDLPCNFVVSCLVKTVEDEETMTTKLMPQLQGSIKDTVAAYFDEVFYLFAKENKDGDIVHHALTHGHDKIAWAKDRSGKLNKIEPPNFWAIHNKIFNNEGDK